MNKIDINKLNSGDKRALAKAITLVESNNSSHRSDAQNLLEKILPKTGDSIRIGISGIPGVGKSTFIESLGQYLVNQGHKVAVLAVDPSSPISGGSIMGDKTRMEKLSSMKDAFIRPSPTSGFLGGVAQNTRESILLCEAAGYDIILVETVGVGQSEYEVASMVDLFLMLMLPNAGDELQGIKKGIVELANLIVINKADGNAIQMAETTKHHYENAVHLFAKDSSKAPAVLTCSALENKGIPEVWEKVDIYIEKSKKNKTFYEKRSTQKKQWMDKLTWEIITAKISEDKELSKLKLSLEKEVQNNKKTPLQAAEELISSFFNT